MHLTRLFLAALAIAGAAVAAESPVAQAAARMAEKTALAPPALAGQFRERAAAALTESFPELARKFTDPASESPQVAKPARVALPPASPEAASIVTRMRTMRALATDADRGRLTVELVRDIRALPEGPRKLALIRSLSNLATEGDLGKEALSGVASTLAGAMHQNPEAVSADEYVGLASLVRYERLEVPSDTALEAALALLALREQVEQANGFTLTGMDGKTYSLAGLKGRIVLLNFWATWCPPCRKEMPDLEKLYKEYQGKGLTVIAVSDEEGAAVEQFLAKTPYHFPIALDPGKKVNAAFSVEGIPKSFVFDREGRLAAQAIDMRTEAQFRTLLKIAGLE